MNKPKLISQQQGMVAIITTMILMIVISLIVLGFSQVVRRNQRQVLDTQLSTQAFYAAESGINLAQQKIKQSPDYQSDDCSQAQTGNEYKLDGDNVKITCLIVDSTLTEQQFDEVSAVGGSKVSLLQREAGGVSDAINEVVINWQGTAGTAATSCPSFDGTYGDNDRALPTSWSCRQPLLRVDLVPLDGTLSQTTLTDNQFTAFLYPANSCGFGGWFGCSNTPTIVPAASGRSTNKGAIIHVGCSNQNSGQKTASCAARITGLGGKKYGIRMMSLYRTSDFITVSVNGPDLTAAPMVGGQIMVDSTGRAGDVIKRVQARLPVGANLKTNDFAIDTAGPLCKTYKVVQNASLLDAPTGGCALP